MDLFFPQSLISCELSIIAWVWGAKQAEGAGVGVALVGLVNPGWLLRCSEQQDGGPHQHSGAERISLPERQDSLLVQCIFAGAEGS